jgi:hypothetical protein
LVIGGTGRSADLGLSGLSRLFSLFGPFRHKTGRWAPKIYPVIATIIIAVAIVVNDIVMLIEV